MSKMEASDSCKIHLDVSLECLAEIGSKEIYGILGPWEGCQVECGAEGVVLPDPCPVGDGC